MEACEIANVQGLACLELLPEPVQLLEVGRDRVEEALEPPSKQLVMAATPGAIGLVFGRTSGLVTCVQPGGEAERFGVKKGWVISRLAGRPYAEQLVNVLLREGKSFTITFVLPESVGRSSRRDERLHARKKCYNCGSKGHFAMGCPNEWGTRWHQQQEEWGTRWYLQQEEEHMRRWTIPPPLVDWCGRGRHHC
jgi:hypothetical protein